MPLHWGRREWQGRKEELELSDQRVRARPMLAFFVPAGAAVASLSADVAPPALKWMPPTADSPHLASPALPWGPPAADSPDLLAYLRNTSRPKLAYSTYIGWYEDGGLNETSLMAQVGAMATHLRPHGWSECCSRCSRCSRCSDDETPSPARVADGLWLRWLRLRDDEWAGR